MVELFEVPFQWLSCLHHNLLQILRQDTDSYHGDELNGVYSDSINQVHRESTDHGHSLNSYHGKSAPIYFMVIRQMVTIVIHSSSMDAPYFFNAGASNCTFMSWSHDISFATGPLYIINWFIIMHNQDIYPG